ncbi:MAG: hypothetical protein A2X80_10935 [Geobacteraceae bacterium GWB2_52_12]|nr:MAG: hypothetical protein A2X80_10935 [Geobacteraceae bacterium GWB2_52_12]
MVSDERGNVLAHSFPAYFGQETLKGAADLLQDNTVGLQEATGGVKLFDIRCELGRLIIKTIPQMFIVVLCQPTVNLSLLLISLNVAAKKLEKMPPEQLLANVAPKQEAPAPAAPAKKVESIPAAMRGYGRW